MSQKQISIEVALKEQIIENQWLKNRILLISQENYDISAKLKELQNKKTEEE